MVTSLSLVAVVAVWMLVTDFVQYLTRPNKYLEEVNLEMVLNRLRRLVLLLCQVEKVFHFPDRYLLLHLLHYPPVPKRKVPRLRAPLMK